MPEARQVARLPRREGTPEAPSNTALYQGLVMQCSGCKQLPSPDSPGLQHCNVPSDAPVRTRVMGVGQKPLQKLG